MARLGKNGKRVKKVSMIGYSLGGLIVRFAIGLLGQRGFFKTIEPDVRIKRIKRNYIYINYDDVVFHHICNTTYGLQKAFKINHIHYFQFCQWKTCITIG